MNIEGRSAYPRRIPWSNNRDPAGIHYRGSKVFRELMDGRPLAELQAAYITLRRLRCQSGVIDALEFARGMVDYKPQRRTRRGILHFWETNLGLTPPVSANFSR